MINEMSKEIFEFCMFMHTKDWIINYIIWYGALCMDHDDYGSLLLLTLWSKRFTYLGNEFSVTLCACMPMNQDLYSTAED